MTPAPPPSHKDDSVDVNDMLNAGKPEHEGLDPDSLDADFEQELEDLFSDDLEEEQAAGDEDDGEPIVLDEYVTVENDGNVTVPDMDMTSDTGDDDELMLLDDLADDDGELLLLDDMADDDAANAVAATLADDEDQDMAALLEDIAEANEPEPESGEDDEVIELDDLLDEPAEELEDLDALLVEAEAEGESGADLDGPGLGDDLDDDLDDDMDDDILLLDEVVTAEPDTEPDTEPDALDAALAGEMMQTDALHAESGQDRSVDEAVPEEALDLLMDEPEDDGSADDGLSDLTGLDALEDDMEDMDSLLDNVEVDVSDVMGDSMRDSMTDDMGEPIADADISDMDLPDMDMPDMDMGNELAREAMPPDAGLDVSDDVDMDQLLADVRPEVSEIAEASLPELQAKVARLEARVAELESRIRQEIANLLPAEAARIIREEISALASELED
ncbi:MAG: hypothetical protein ABIK45_07810 [Pseudomonadota bacterium]